MNKETLIAHLGENRSDYKGAVVPPIYQNSLFTFETAEAIDEAFSNFQESYIYTRGNNPTVKIVEEKLAALENGEKAKLFTSGMAAITAGIMNTVNSGDHIICVQSVYGPTNNFITKYLGEKYKIKTTFVEGKQIEDFEKAIKKETKLIYLESPSSGVFYMQDLREIAKIAKKHNIVTMIDNTWATPLFQNPIDYGIDIVAHSVSKYISGHSDVVAGVLISSKERIESVFSNEHNFIGGKISPFEAWLILRGLRTLPVRMKQHQASAKKIVEYLETKEQVVEICSPISSSYNQSGLAKKYLKGFSGLLSITLNMNAKEVKLFLNKLKFFKIGVSWGGYESLAYAPIISLEKELSKEQLEKAKIHPGLVRLSIGLENSEDLIADLEQAFKINK